MQVYHCIAKLWLSNYWLVYDFISWFLSFLILFLFQSWTVLVFQFVDLAKNRTRMLKSIWRKKSKILIQHQLHSDSIQVYNSRSRTKQTIASVEAMTIAINAITNSFQLINDQNPKMQHSLMFLAQCIERHFFNCCSRQTSVSTIIFFLLKSRNTAMH